MKAEIISIGTELIIGDTVNTNATYISERLGEIGVSVHYHSSVGDNAERIKHCFRQAISRSDLILCTGGLGPTDDDISHDVLADFTGLKLAEDSEQKKILIDKFHKIGTQDIPNINYRQARVIDTAQVIPNPIGTAIGMFLNLDRATVINDPQYTETHQSCIITTFPGVPCEMEVMLEFVIEKLKIKSGVIISRKIRLTNITESRMAQRILDYYKSQNLPNPFTRANPSLAPYATLGECYLRITAQADNKEEAQILMQDQEKILEKLFPEEIFGYDDDTFVSILAAHLRKKQYYIAFAESCTGGLASKLMTDLPGASDYTKFNLVTYSNEAKKQMLGVSEEILNQFGAVSEESAKAMALGLSQISGAQVNVSITGIAGPDGTSQEKPVGTVFVAVVINGILVYSGKLIWHHRPLSREQVRELTCKKVFHLVTGLIC